jgi:hypothetical protein
MTLLVTLATFVLLLILRSNVLHDPPYWDGAMGAWGEANAVANRAFDVRHHLLKEPMWLQGGDAVYRISLPVYAIAFGMVNLSTPHLIIVTHIISFFIASLLAVTFYSAMRGVVGHLAALLSTLALMTSPLFSSQIDMVGIDLPALLFGWVAISSCVNRQYGLSSVASLLAFLSKPSGMVYTMAIVGFLVIRLLASLDSRFRSDLGRTLVGLAVNGLSLTVQWSILSWLFARGYGTNWRVLMLIPYWVPDIALLLVISMIGFAAYVLFDRERGETFTSFLHRLTNQHGLLSISLLVLVLLFAGLTKVSAIPRYLIYGYAPLFALFTGVLFWRKDQAALAMKILMGIVLINIVNWKGLMYPSSEACGRWEGFSAGTTAHEGSFLERSRAFRDDLQDVRKAIVAAQKDGAPVVAGGAFANYLTSPRLGYVNAPVNGYLSDGLRDNYHSMKSPAALLHDLPRELVFIYCQTSLAESFPLLDMPKPEETDEILFSSGGRWPIVVFKRKWDSSISNQELTFEIARRLWPIPNPFTGGSPSEVNTTRYRVEQFTKLGRKDLARWIAAEALRNPSSEQTMAELKAIQDRIDNPSN